MTFEEQLENNGKLIYTNKGVSMMPLLRQNRDIMVIETYKSPAASSDKNGTAASPDQGNSDIPRKYDAVLFTRDNRRLGKKQYVLHRILRVNPDGTYWIVGDNCTAGETVKREQILGKLTSIIRDGRQVKVTDPLYLLYVHLWCDCYPLRFFLLRLKNFIFRALRYIKRHLLPKKH